MRQFVGIARDHSGSMYSLTRPAVKDYNGTLAAIKNASDDTSIDTVASVVSLGGGVRIEVRNAHVADLKPMTSYPTHGGTPLFDAVNTLIETLQNAPGSAHKDATFLIMAITDGVENESRTTGDQLSEKMRDLQATDRWTFVFRVPKGYARNLTSLGIPKGNIQEWEQTEESLLQSAAVTVASIGNYYKGVSRGLTSTRSFYTDMSNVSLNKVKATMVDISKEVKVYIATERAEISSFLTKMTGDLYIKGTGFYQLTKTEKAVQDYKLIVVRNKKTGAVYYGATARDILGLPGYGTIKLIPGDHGDWDIYVQSVSTNRILPAGTSILYWRKVR